MSLLIELYVFVEDDDIEFSNILLFVGFLFEFLGFSFIFLSLLFEVFEFVVEDDFFLIIISCFFHLNFLYLIVYTKFKKNK